MNSLKFISLALALMMFVSCAASPANVTDDPVKEVRKRSSQKAMEISHGDVEAEIQFGRELAARILGKYRLYDNDTANRYVNVIGKGLSTFSPRPELEFKFGILNTDMINAFASPGGYIFITKGTLEIIENEAQLAGVLAHEIAHITERHIVRELDIKGRDDSAAAGFAAMLGGGTSETIRSVFTQIVDKASKILFEDGLKFSDEIDSDALSVMMISNAGYNPLAYKKLLEDIAKKKGAKYKKNKKILSDTHPSFKDRIKAINKIIAEEGLNELDYANVKSRYKKYIKL